MSRENLVIFAIAAVIVLYRVSQPQRITVARMWLMVGLLIFIAGTLVYQSIRLFNPPLWEIALSAVAGLLLGLPLGILRGHHTVVSATDRHGVMQLGPSWQTAAIYIGAFAVRFAIRQFFPMTSAVGDVVGDGLVFFAIGVIAAAYVAIYRKYEALDHAAPQSV
jgi:hypothetical protein